MRQSLRCAGLTLGGALFSTSVFAADLTIASGAVATDIEVLRQQLDLFEKQSGHKVQIAKLPPSTTDQFALYKTWLSEESVDVDVYRIDVIWPPQIANHLIDLTEATKDVVDDHFPAIIEPDGTISINNPKAAAAIDLAATWDGDISPPGVTGYMEEDARGVWQTGNAVFMRNWPYAYAGSNSADSSVKG